MAEIKLSDCLFDTANAVVQMAKHSGLDVKLTQCYSSEGIKDLAVIGALVRQLAQKLSGTEITVVDDSNKG